MRNLKQILTKIKYWLAGILTGIFIIFYPPLISVLVIAVILFKLVSEEHKHKGRKVDPIYNLKKRDEAEKLYQRYLANPIQAMLPKYRCQTVAYALKIKEVSAPLPPNSDGCGGLMLIPEDLRQQPLYVDKQFVDKNPNLTGGGYYAIKKDETASYISSEVFEEEFKLENTQSKEESLRTLLKVVLDQIDDDPRAVQFFDSRLIERMKEACK